MMYSRGSLRVKFVLLAVVALAAAIAKPVPTRACSCADGMPPVDVAFIGGALAVFEASTFLDLVYRPDYSPGNTVALLRTEVTLQGESHPFLLVIGGNGRGADCTVQFERGAFYNVTGMRGRLGLIETNTCIGTHIAPWFSIDSKDQ